MMTRCIECSQGDCVNCSQLIKYDNVGLVTMLSDLFGTNINQRPCGCFNATPDLHRAMARI